MKADGDTIRFTIPNFSDTGRSRLATARSFWVLTLQLSAKKVRMESIPALLSTNMITALGQNVNVFLSDFLAVGVFLQIFLKAEAARLDLGGIGGAYKTVMPRLVSVLSD